MGVRLRDVLMGRLDELRYEPIEKRIRAQMGDATLIDSTRAMLVWEPRRVVPTYAVPAEDIAGEVVAAPAAERVDTAAAGVPPMGPAARRPHGARPQRLPPQRTDLLRPSATRTSCAYKGQASYWSLPDGEEVACSYPQPQREAAEVTGRIAFFSERVDIVVDGTPLPQELTPWSRR